jgi:predicted MPP superfamily phosphohydrolase
MLKTTLASFLALLAFQVQTIATLASGRKIMIAKISDIIYKLHFICKKNYTLIIQSTCSKKPDPVIKTRNENQKS